MFNVFITIVNEISPSIFSIFCFVSLTEYVNIYQTGNVLYPILTGADEAMEKQWWEDRLIQ